MCRFQYTPFVNLVQDTRRWQCFTEGSWAFGRGLQLSAELLVARTKVPNWTTSPSYPPSDVIDPARRILAGHPALVDMASKYPDLYGDYAYCDAHYCRWQGDEAEQDATGVPPQWQAVAWINGRHFGQNGPIRTHPRRSATERVVVKVEGEWNTASWDAALTYARTRRLEEDGAGLHYRSLRALVGLGGYDCEGLVPNRYDAVGNLRFDWQTLSDHAGRGPCRYWSPFSNAMPAHHQVPGSGNPDYEPALDQQDLASYLLTDRGFKGSASLAALDAVVYGDTPWEIGGGFVSYAIGAQVRREDYVRREYSGEAGSRGGALQDLERYPCRGSPDLADCADGRSGVFIYLPPGYDVKANRLIYAGFGELALPLVDSADARFSLRYEDYPQQGLSSLDPKLALRWQASPSLTLRASAGTAFRAPTINQIEPGIASTSRQFVTRIATFKPILALGNPDLEPEAATTFNVGAILEGEGLLGIGDRLFASVDYWRYGFEEPLVLEPYERVLDVACPADQVLCAAGSAYFGRIDFGGRPSVSDIAAISVSVVNVFNVGDREPPRVYRQLNYDPLTHNPLGRIVQIGARWRL